VLITMKNNFNKKAKDEKIMHMFDRSFGNSWDFNKKNFFESNLKNKCNIAFLDTPDFGSKCDEWFIGSHLM
jgi:hypothetical protein